MVRKVPCRCAQGRCQRGLSISDTGAITLAPKLTEVFKTEQSYVWSGTVDAQGNFYLGPAPTAKYLRSTRPARVHSSTIRQSSPFQPSSWDAGRDLCRDVARGQGLPDRCPAARRRVLFRPKENISGRWPSWVMEACGRHRRERQDIPRQGR